MKPLTNSGGLVDFKEKLIFEEYKDKVIINAKVFRKEIKKEYGFEPSSALFRKITNYQIKKYGCVLYRSNTGERDFIPKFHQNTKKWRDNQDDLKDRRKKEQKLIERIEKRKRNGSK